MKWTVGDLIQQHWQPAMCMFRKTEESIIQYRLILFAYSFNWTININKSYNLGYYTETNDYVILYIDVLVEQTTTHILLMNRMIYKFIHGYNKFSTQTVYIWMKTRNVFSFFCIFHTERKCVFLICSFFPNLYANFNQDAEYWLLTQFLWNRIFFCFSLFFFSRSRILFVAYTFEKVNKRCVIIILSFSWCISRWTWMRCRIRCHTNILFTRWHFGGFNAFWKQLWNVIVFDGRQYHAGLAGLWW